MTLLVDDLLDLSRFDAGVVPLDVEEIELEPLLDDCLALYAADARSAQVRLERECPPGLRGRCDPLQLGRVLSNLVGNAIRHTPPGGRVADQRARRRRGERDRHRRGPAAGRGGARVRALLAGRREPRVPAAPASASPSRARSWSCTAARSASPTRPAAGACFTFTCRRDGPVERAVGAVALIVDGRHGSARSDGIGEGDEAPDLAPVTRMRPLPMPAAKAAPSAEPGWSTTGSSTRPVTSATTCFHSADARAAVRDARARGRDAVLGQHLEVVPDAVAEALEQRPEHVAARVAEAEPDERARARAGR